MKNTLIVFFCFVSFANALLAKQEREEILSFHSDIQVQQDGSMVVTETIEARAQGEKIKRGIYRDFPTKYKDRNGLAFRVGFNVLGVKKNGRHEPWHIKKMSNGVRVYIGSKNVFLRKGVYTYQITYETHSQLGFFEKHDELYWNVTGNGWDFKILKSSCTIQLPFDVEASQLQLTGYTGKQGSKEQKLTYEAQHSGAMFKASRALRRREGLTIVLGWPKGHIKEPTMSEKIQKGVSDNMPLLYYVLGNLVLVIYYLIVWNKVGRDPEKGSIVPLFEPPSGLSPAAVRFISKMGFDKKCMSASIVNLCVSGHLKIEDDEGEYTLYPTHNSKKCFSEEEELKDDLLKGRNKLTLKKSHHTKIKKALDQLKKGLRASYLKKYFFKNSGYVVPGVLWSIALVFYIFYQYFQTFEGEMGASLFLLVWLTPWTFAVIAIWMNLFIPSLVKFFRHPGVGNLFSIFFALIFVVPFTAAEIVVSYLLFEMTSLSVVGALLCAVLFTVGIHYLFFFLLKAPTKVGRKVMDEIEGFKMYLSTAEQDRLDRMHPPEKTVEVFEKNLPYAIALDVENKWADQFSSVLKAASVDGSATNHGYRPLWYTGTSFHLSDMTSSLGSSLSGAISSSSTAPGSSGGGGGFSSGGSSGGGGGGGGGGGW